MHAVKATRREPGVSAGALMDQMTVAHMSRLSFSFGIALSLEFISQASKRRSLRDPPLALSLLGVRVTVRLT